MRGALGRPRAFPPPAACRPADAASSTRGHLCRLRRGRRGRARRRAALHSGSIAASGSAAPDLVLPGPPGGALILVFGAIHGERGAGIGDFILRSRPATVVVETAVNTAHGSATGNVARLEDCLSRYGPGGASDAGTLMLARAGMELSSSADPLATALWADLSASSVPSERLAYIAAFAVGAALVYGDRPKDLTYRRMLWRPSVADLDAAFGSQSAVNYGQLTSGTALPKAPSASGPPDRVFFVERDAVLLESLHRASAAAGAGHAVVGVVGASHLPGMRRMWADGSWRETAATAQELPLECGQGEAPEVLGVRRALLDSVIRLSCRHELVADAARVLGPPPPAAAAAYHLTRELYGTSRMLMAVLEPEQLAEVCQGWRCDMYAVLQPLRDVRPVNGGPGYDEELVMDLRTLNFDPGPPRARCG